MDDQSLPLGLPSLTNARCQRCDCAGVTVIAFLGEEERPYCDLVCARKDGAGLYKSEKPIRTR